MWFAPLGLSFDGPAPAPAQPDAPEHPGAVTPAPGTLTFEVVDAHGAQLIGRYRVEDVVNALEGALGGVVTLDSPVAPRLRLQVDLSPSPGHHDG